MEDNPWNVKSFDEFLFYICPECNYFSKELEGLLDHAEDLHGENYSKVKLHSKIEVSETIFISNNSSPMKQCDLKSSTNAKVEVSMTNEHECEREPVPGHQIQLKKASKRKQTFERKRSGAAGEELTKQCEYCESPLYYNHRDMLKHLNENHDIVVVVTDRAKKQPKLNYEGLKQNEEVGKETFNMSSSILKTEPEDNSTIVHNDDPLEPVENEPESNSKVLKHNEEIGMETCAVKTEPKDDSTIAHDDPTEPIENEPISKSNALKLKHNEDIVMETCAVKTEPENDTTIVHDDPKEPIEKDPLAISSFQCESCGMKCKTEKGFKKHLDACSNKKLKTCNNNLPDFTLETCDLCLAKVSSLKYPEHRHTCELALKVHNRKDFTIRHESTCNECGEKFSDADALVQHVALHKKTGYVCKKCQRQFGRASELKNHTRACVTKVMVECEFCKKQITSTYIRQHIKNMHSSDSRVKCAYCKTEMGRNYISTHFRNQHPGIEKEFTIVKNKTVI